MRAYFTKIHGNIKGFGLSDYLKTCKDGTYQIDIVRKHNNRSLEQNHYMWGVVYDILSKELGYDIDDIHEVLKQKFLSKPVIIKKDKRFKFKRIRSTSELTTVEFEQYMADIRAFFLFRTQEDRNNGITWIYIPLPNEYDTK